MCGVVGLKPTYGLISRRGAFPLSFTLDHIGPMARTVTDVALTLDALAGHNPGDSGSLRSCTSDFGVDLERGVRGLRIGFVRHFHQTDLLASAETVLQSTGQTVALCPAYGIDSCTEDSDEC